MAKRRKLRNCFIVTIFFIFSGIFLIMSLLKIISLDKLLIYNVIAIIVLMIILAFKRTYLNKKRSVLSYRKILLSILSIVFIGVSISINYFNNSAYKVSAKNMNNTVELDKPFTVLMLGIDSTSNSIDHGDSYNGDSIIIASFNPKSMSMTLLSVPRDSKVYITCKDREDKVNAASMYGTKCLKDTIEKLLDIRLDYYIKINFNGLIDLVDALGGVTVDVENAFCEQDSKRRFGSNTIYVEKGVQSLNGEEALAYARNRHNYKGFCPDKYTKGGRNDFSRIKHQKELIAAIINKTKNTKSINTVNNVIDAIAKNMETNMNKDSMLSLFPLLKKLGNQSFIIDNLYLKGSDRMMALNGKKYRQYFYELDEEELKKISREIKMNLDIIKAPTPKIFTYE